MYISKKQWHKKEAQSRRAVPKENSGFVDDAFLAMCLGVIVVLDDYIRSQHLSLNCTLFCNQSVSFLTVSHLYGFGLVDAEAMVLEATKWRTVPPQHTCSPVPERRTR